jgi:hypothetical protein
MDTPAPRLKLRLLICNPKSYGPKNITCKGSITNGTTPRTREDPYLPGVCSYECKSEAEWQRLTTGISKQISNQHSFHAYAMLVDTSLPPGPAARVLLDANGLYEPIAPEEALVDAPEPPEEVQQWFNKKIREALLGEPEGEAVEIVSTSQEGSEPVEAHNLDEVGATPTPATIQDPAPEEQAETTPEPIVEPEPETSTLEPEEKPLYAAAWEKLEAPMRLKDLAAALEVDAETLKASLQDPLSTVELGHAGWVKRQA